MSHFSSRCLARCHNVTDQYAAEAGAGHGREDDLSKTISLWHRCPVSAGHYQSDAMRKSGMFGLRLWPVLRLRDTQSKSQSLPRQTMSRAPVYRTERLLILTFLMVCYVMIFMHNYNWPLVSFYGGFRGCLVGPNERVAACITWPGMLVMWPKTSLGLSFRAAGIPTCFSRSFYRNTGTACGITLGRLWQGIHHGRQTHCHCLSSQHLGESCRCQSCRSSLTRVQASCSIVGNLWKHKHEYLHKVRRMWATIHNFLTCYEACRVLNGHHCLKLNAKSLSVFNLSHGALRTARSLAAGLPTCVIN